MIRIIYLIRIILRKTLYIIGNIYYNVIIMNISFRTKKLCKIMNSEKELIREYGPEIGRKIKNRLALLDAAPCLEDVPTTPPARRHSLAQNREGQFSVDLKQPHRLIFMPNHNPLPVKEDGGIDLKKVTAIEIIEVEDYH